MGALLALALAAATATGSLPPPPLELYRVAWHKPLVPMEILEWKPREPAGAGVDPVTGTVVVGSRDGKVRAYGPDGRAMWDFHAGGIFWTAPTVDGATVYAGSDSGVLHALELGTGRERWRYDAQEEIGGGPVVSGGLVYFSTLQDTVFALDARTGAWKWHHRRDPEPGFSVRGAASPAVSGGVLYAGYSDGTVAALDAATGAVRWERRVAPRGDLADVDSTPQISGSRLFVAAYSGAVLALDARTGAVDWEVKAPGACRTLLAGNTLYAVTLTQVIALAPRDGTQIWAVPLQGVPAGPPALAGKWLLVPNTAGLLFLDPASGQLLRYFDPGTGVSAPPTASGSRLYVVSNGGELLALDLR